LPDEEALAVYRQVLQLDADRPETHYNVGLIYKYQAKWPESFEHNKKAAELDPVDEAINWNLAIAATALRDWRTAREVLNRLGKNVELGTDPIDLNFGITPVRLNPEDGAEVVWGRRIDPVRARIESIPFASSGFRCGDIVLHDGAAVGHRVFDDREYPVFNVLEMFEPSRLSTFEAEIQAVDVSDLQELLSALDKSGIENEDWTTTVRHLCRQCSEGRPHDHHDDDGNAEWIDRHVIGIAAIDAIATEEILRHWVKGARKLLRFQLRLSPPIRH